jgi:glutamine amidotransferase
MIGILEFGMCNLRSVKSAVEHLGQDAVFISEGGTDTTELSHLIIPGVGNFHLAMENIRSRGLDRTVAEVASRKKPILGICLGMQLLAESGVEGGETAGLGMVPGRIEKISADYQLPVPHMGWNNLEIRRPHPILKRIKDHTDYYFVHSYHFVADASDSVATTHYGADLCAIVGRKNIVGVQFHPEKSQLNGLRILESFLDWDGHD